MINKEVLELKKRIKLNSSTIKIAGCYVAGDERKKLTYINKFLRDAEEVEQHKYVELLKKPLSGAVGKTLNNIDFTEEAEKEGQIQSSLLAVRDSELKSDELLDTFYDYIIEKFAYVGNYLILLMYDVYDVPRKTKDNFSIDESTETYRYVVCAICPVNLAKPALSYHENTNLIEPRNRDWVVEPPKIGFLFPAFNDRSADIHSMLYYAKSSKEMFEDFIEDALGCSMNLPGFMQKQIMKDIIEQVVLNQPQYEVVNVVREVNEQVNQILEENKESEEPVLLNKKEIKDILKVSGIQEEDLSKIDDMYETSLGEETLLNARDIYEDKGFDVKTNNVTLKLKSEDASIVKVQMVEGRKCLVIPMDKDVEINGILSRVKEELDNKE